MKSNEKKAFLLLKAVFFHYHGVDAGEMAALKSKAQEIQGQKELSWVLAFVEEDTTTAEARSEQLLGKLAADITPAQRISYLKECWQEGMQKSYLTDSEAIWLLKIARIWEMEDKILEEVDI